MMNWQNIHFNRLTTGLLQGFGDFGMKCKCVNFSRYLSGENSHTKTGLAILNNLFSSNVH